MSGVALSGLASGVDTSSIVDQLMAIDRQQVTRMQLRQSAIQTGGTQLNDLQTKVSALKLAASDLSSMTTWGSTQQVTSSDAKVVVTRTGGAPIGGSSINVTQLASSAQKTFNWTPSASAQTLTLGYDYGGSPITVNIAANATAADVASTLNGNTDVPVYAAVINGTQLVLSSRKTGNAGAFSASGDGLGTPVSSVAAKQAQFSIDGGATQTSDTNVLASQIPGLRIALKGLTSSPASITVEPPAPDTELVKTKVQAFVTAYNALVDATNSRVTEKSIPNATTADDAAAGQFFGDTGLTSMLSSLRRGMSDAFGALGNPTTLDSLSELGISTGTSTGSVTDDSKLGKLSIDMDKLTDALTTDPVSVRRLLGGVGGAGGLAQRVGDMVTKSFAPMLANKITSGQHESDDIGDQIDQTNKLLDSKEARLKAQFAAMETAMAQVQSQQSWLTGQINSLG